jgi:predicted DNA-binding transcriptional regulator YafY
VPPRRRRARQRDRRGSRVDRIARVTIGEEHGPVPDGFDAVAVISRSLARVPWTWEVELVAAAPIDAVRRDVPADVGELVEDLDGTHVLLRAEDLDGAARMLAAMPWRFSVVRPTELRDALRRRAEQLLDAVRS